MLGIDNYTNIRVELSILNKRLQIIETYEKEILIEKERLNSIKQNQLKIIKLIEKDIKELTGIENGIYKEIVINGLNVSKAIEKISQEMDKDVSTLWKNYYPNVKKRIEKLKKKEEKNEAN